MPVNAGQAAPPPDPYNVPDGNNDPGEGNGTRVTRRLFVTDKDGNEVEIRSPKDLQDILDQMTPEQLETWKQRYRFAPVQNNTSNSNYVGTNRDL
jgi:hypothetical protein